MPGLRDRLTDAGYGLGWSVVCRLPESWARRGFRFAADRAWRRQGPGVQVLEGNLRRVIGSQAPGGELRALSRQAMRSYARYWLEAFQRPVMPADRLIGEVLLRVAAGDGRLTAEELDGRLEAALTARACGELAALTTDLPAIPDSAPGAPVPELKDLARIECHGSRLCCCGRGKGAGIRSAWAGCRVG